MSDIMQQARFLVTPLVVVESSNSQNAECESNMVSANPGTTTSVQRRGWDGQDLQAMQWLSTALAIHLMTSRWANGQYITDIV